MQERAYFLLQLGQGGGFDDDDRYYDEGDRLDIPGDDDEDQDEDEEEDDNDEDGEVEEDDDEEEEVDEGEEDLEEAGVEARAAGEDQLDGANFDSDEAYARALQDKEDRETTARLMALAGIRDSKYLSDPTFQISMTRLPLFSCSGTTIWRILLPKSDGIFVLYVYLCS